MTLTLYAGLALLCFPPPSRAQDNQATEIAFDLGQQMMQITTNNQIQQFHLDASGYASSIQNITTVERPDQLTFWSGPASQPVVLPVSDAENLQDLLDKWSFVGTGIAVQGGLMGV